MVIRLKVIAKFRCNSIEWYSPEPDGARRVKLSPAFPGKDATEEDKAFWRYTPSGSIDMYIDNPPASDLFEIGKNYYITFEAA